MIAQLAVRLLQAQSVPVGFIHDLHLRVLAGLRAHVPTGRDQTVAVPARGAAHDFSTDEHLPLGAGSTGDARRARASFVGRYSSTEFRSTLSDGPLRSRSSNSRLRQTPPP